jgi:glycosyltransferase involved in cell wall biosynthesis
LDGNAWTFFFGSGCDENEYSGNQKGGYGNYFKEYAYYCEPDDLDSIRRAVIAAFEAPFNEELSDRILKHYKWEDTAKATLEGYNRIIGKQ